MSASAGAEGDQEGRVWLAGVRLDPNDPDPDFYTLLRDQPAYWPIMHDGQIVFFRDAAAAPAALRFVTGNASPPPGGVPAQPAVILDFAHALYLLSAESRDETACVLNLLNTLLDMLAAAAIVVPAKARDALHRTADHLTFSQDFGPLLADPLLTRAGIIEALQWALGAAMTKAMFFPKPGAGSAAKPEGS